jgi:hypothetical protein
LFHFAEIYQPAKGRIEKGRASKRVEVGCIGMDGNTRDWIFFGGCGFVLKQDAM